MTQRAPWLTPQHAGCHGHYLGLHLAHRGEDVRVPAPGAAATTAGSAGASTPGAAPGLPPESRAAPRCAAAQRSGGASRSNTVHSRCSCRGPKGLDRQCRWAGPHMGLVMAKRPYASSSSAWCSEPARYTVPEARLLPSSNDRSSAACAHKTRQKTHSGSDCLGLGAVVAGAGVGRPAPNVHEKS